jgi:Rhodopirellula transposase DDE domain
MRKEERETLLRGVRSRYESLGPHLPERSHRLWAASEASAIGRSGVAVVCEATGIARATILKGQAELLAPQTIPTEGQRRAGGGRKPLTQTDATLLRDLDWLIAPHTRGAPESPLRWTSKSTYHLAEALKQSGHHVSQRTVYAMLVDMDYSLQANRKTEEGADHPDRAAQFEHIAAAALRFQRANEPVVSVDAKKKELVGNYGGCGKEWQRACQPVRVRTHDFPDPEESKAIPYGVYDLTRNEGWVSVGISHNTAQFAVASIRGWWHKLGQKRYPRARKLLLTADAGGANGYRPRLWKWCLQELADETRLPIQVCHFPPGTSKWNKIEHRLFSFISRNWRGKPLDSLATIVSLIAKTTNKTGLSVEASLDYNSYNIGIKISDAQMALLRIEPQSFHGEWNYIIRPRQEKSA